MQDALSLSAASNLSAGFGANLVAMVEPITAALGAGYTLLEALWNVKEVCLKKRNNDDIVRELSVFITNLNLDLVTLKNRSPRSNSAMWAAGALKEDLDRAAEYVGECLKRGFIKSVWSVNTIYDKLKRIREGLATSFQIKLQIIVFDVVIDEQSKQEEFRAKLFLVQRGLRDALADSAVVQREWKDEVHQVNANIVDLRAEFKALLQPVLDGVAALQDRNMNLDTAIALIRSTEPQTSETEKFFADVLANLEGRRDRRVEEGEPSAQDVDAEDRWFEDPITAEVMCDPVKCSDGRTYDRWTVIDHHMVVSPFDKSLPEFGIVLDDINVRTRLFRMFPKQEDVFHARRLRHREEALEHASKGEYGDALDKLDHVLQWARSDQECIAMRDEVLKLLQGLQITAPEEEDGEAPTHMNILDHVEGKNAKGWFPSQFSFRSYIGNSPCPRNIRLSQASVFPGYYFEVHNQDAELYQSIGFTLQGQQYPLLYEYGSGGRSDPGLGFAVPGGPWTELWSCDTVAELKENESGVLSFPRRVLNQVMGAGINRASKEVFFTRNGELKWLLVGASHLDSGTELYPAVCSDKISPYDSRKGVNLGEHPFRFEFEKMFTPDFRRSLVGRVVVCEEGVGGTKFVAHARQSIGLT